MAKRYDVGVVMGRFQNFHIGHKSLIDLGLDLCERVLVIIGSAQESGTERNPFPVSKRIEWMRACYKDDSNVDIVSLADLTNENDITPEWGTYLMSYIEMRIYKKPCVLIYGNDEYRGKEWFTADEMAGVTEIIVNRDALPVSGTLMREWLMTNNTKKWFEFAPLQTHKFFNDMRGDLLAVPYYKGGEYD